MTHPADLLLVAAQGLRATLGSGWRVTFSYGAQFANDEATHVSLCVYIDDSDGKLSHTVDQFHDFDDGRDGTAAVLRVIQRANAWLAVGVALRAFGAEEAA
jgi:hypothetical protein